MGWRHSRTLVSASLRVTEFTRINGPPRRIVGRPLSDGPGRLPAMLQGGSGGRWPDLGQTVYMETSDADRPLFPSEPPRQSYESRIVSERRKPGIDQQVGQHRRTFLIGP